MRTIINDKIENVFPALADSFQVGATMFKPWPFVVSDEFTDHTVLGCDFLNFASAVFVSRPGILLISTDHTPAQKVGEILRSYGYYEANLVMARSGKHLKMHRVFGGTDTTVKSGVLLAPVVIEGKMGYSSIPVPLSHL